MSTVVRSGIRAYFGFRLYCSATLCCSLFCNLYKFDVKVCISSSQFCVMCSMIIVLTAPDINGEVFGGAAMMKCHGLESKQFMLIKLVSNLL